MVDTMNLRCEIFDMLRDHIGANIAKRVSNVVDVLKLAAQVEDFPPVTDRIALANGTLYLDGTFKEGKGETAPTPPPLKSDLRPPPPAPRPLPLRAMLLLRRFRLFPWVVEKRTAASARSEKKQTTPLPLFALGNWHSSIFQNQRVKMAL